MNLHAHNKHAHTYTFKHVHKRTKQIIEPL